MGWFDWAIRRQEPVAVTPDVPEQPAQPEPYSVDVVAVATGDLARASLFLAPLNAAAVEHDIVAGRRPLMFLAQVAHESGGFRYLTEIWGPTPAQARYEGRADLGNTEPGDGSLFRGRGLLQVTGRANYAEQARHFGISFPRGIISWLLTPEGACRSAAWYWESHGCNELADADDFVGVTKRINGGLNGYADRLRIYRELCEKAGGLVPNQESL